TGPLTHIGLGGHSADAIRVVWPNGVPQEVIEPVPNQIFTEMQILKGSCPFLATSNEDGSWEFVTDLLWRSPLGLKINAQTVPPIAATQDWVKVRSDQLKARDGIYELAVTAQLWETHFIDCN
ncbi:MAG: ASPIC/UnbV domain-containing protein, partial [Phycisphaerales bacterium]